MGRCSSPYSFRLFVALPLAIATLFLTGCGKISSEVSAIFKGKTDFARSEIITSGTGVADGSTEMLVVIQLMNSDGTPVKLYKPTYEIVSGSGVTAQECTTSNSNGVSTCILKATQAGTKRLSVTNIKIELQKDLLFQLPSSKTMLGLASGAKQITTSGYKVSASVATQESAMVRESGGWKFYGGVEGNAASR